MNGHAFARDEVIRQPVAELKDEVVGDVFTYSYCSSNGYWQVQYILIVGLGTG